MVQISKMRFPKIDRILEWPLVGPIVRPQRLTILVCLLLAALTAASFWALPTHDFVGFDDDIYVTENPHVQNGLTGKGFLWAFSTSYAEFWHPLTWLSHMLDCELFGLEPEMHHLTSLLLHMVNSVLLFLVLRGMTGALWRSAFVAALFALHPIHVERLRGLRTERMYLAPSSGF